VEQREQLDAGGTPLPTDDVRFDNTSTANSALDSALTISTLTCAAGYTGTVTTNAGLTILKDVSLAAGAFSLGASSWTVFGNWTNTGRPSTPAPPR